MDQLRKTHENLKKNKSSTKRRKRWSLVKTQPNKEYQIGRRKKKKTTQINLTEHAKSASCFIRLE